MVMRKKRTAITTRALEELDHIPRAERGSTQNELRMLYWFWRTRDLARDPGLPAARALDASVETIRQTYPYFQPDFDRDYFGMGGDV